MPSDSNDRAFITRHFNHNHHAGHWQEQEERQHVREMEVSLCLPMSLLCAPQCSTADIDCLPGSGSFDVIGVRCYDCQGFGQITCPLCGGGEGLTPEQRRER